MTSLLKLEKTLQWLFWSKANIGIDPKLTESYGNIES